MNRHPVYTRVPMSSFVAAEVAIDGTTLGRVMQALAIGHLESEDISEEHGRVAMVPPHSLRDFADEGKVQLADVLETISQWVMTQSDAEYALDELTGYDHKLGVWCACQVARHGLQAVPHHDHHLPVIIDVLERWVTGQGTVEDCRRAVEMADACSRRVDSMTGLDLANSVAYAAEAAAARANEAMHYTTATAGSIARVCARSMVGSGFDKFADVTLDDIDRLASGKESERWTSAKNAELVRLREIVSAACLSYPGNP